jgi:XTP/dITP diphosphohydrolase
MMELLIATGNRGKLAEIRELLTDCVEKFFSMDDFPDLPEVVEDGDTFEANAIKKGRSAALATGKPVIADDSGLEVDSLGGAPGVRSARFAGEDANDSANNEKLLKAISHITPENRGAAFRCVGALCLPDGSCRTFTGSLEGLILKEPRGSGGFGYDPLFMVPEYDKTLAELPLEVKNAISHRGRALQGLKAFLKGDAPADHASPAVR